MTYEIRAMGLAEILDTGFRLLRNHFGILFGAALALYLPLGVFTAVLEHVFQTPAAGGTIDVTLILVSVAGMLLSFSIVSPIVSCAITHALGELYLGRVASLGASFRVALSLLLRVVGTSLLASLAVLMGLLLLVLPGLYLAVAFVLVTQVIVIERIAGVPALGRSRELMQGNMLRGIGLGFVIGLLGAILSVGLELAFALVPAVSFLGGTLAQSLVFAYSSAVLVVFYFDIRARKEAFDLEHLARVVESRLPEPGATPPA